MAKRSKEAEEAFEKLRGDIKATYKQAELELSEKLQKFAQRFAAQDQEKRAQVSAGQMTQGQYDSWLRGQVFRGDRWKAMKKDCLDQIRRANKTAVAIENAERRAVFQRSANYSAYQIERGTNGAVNFTLYDSATATRLLDGKQKMLPDLKVNERRDESWNGRGIQNAITQGIIQGESIPDIAKRIAIETGERNRAAMTRQARTAMTGAQNAGRMQAMRDAEDQGVKVRKRWIATLDKRTRDAHAELDGQVVDADEPFIVNGMEIMFPGDPNADPSLVYNCRCTLGWVYPDYTMTPGMRRDNETGEIVGGLTYDEWETKKKNGELASMADLSTLPPMERIKQRVSTHQGTWKLDEVQAVGLDMQQELETRKLNLERSMVEESDAVHSEIDTNFDRINELRDEIRRIDFSAMDTDDPEERKRLFKRGDDLEIELRRLETRNEELGDKMVEISERYGKAEASLLSDLLSEVRPVGGVTDANVDGFADLTRYPLEASKVRTATVQAMSHYPTAWLEHSKADRRTLAPHWTTGRAYCSWTGEIRFEDSEATNVHEMAHRFEMTVPGIVQSERAFYARRTKGETLKWLGSGYGKDELTRRDSFLDPYMGKDYGGTAFELFSMGAQYAFTEPDRLAKDPDMQSWVFGLLASIP